MRLEPVDLQSRVSSRLEFELVPGYASGVADLVSAEKTITNNLHAYNRNVKDICELLPLLT